MDMTTTILALAGLTTVFGLCLLGERRPRQFGKVRLFPYIPVMIVCLVLVLAVMAHALTLLSGRHG